jgi:arsenate reductase
LAYEVVDITMVPPSKDELLRAFDRLERRQLLFNTSGQSYRALGAEVVKAMSDDDALACIGRRWAFDQTPFCCLA